MLRVNRGKSQWDVVVVVVAVVVIVGGGVMCRYMHDPSMFVVVVVE